MSSSNRENSTMGVTAQVEQCDDVNRSGDTQMEIDTTGFGMAFDPMATTEKYNNELNGAVGPLPPEASAAY